MEHEERQAHLGQCLKQSKTQQSKTFKERIIMHKRRLVTSRAVSMAMLFMVASTWSIFATDPATPAGDATSPAASATKTSATDQITALKQQMAAQQKQIEQMQKSLQEQLQLLEQLTKPASAPEQAAQPVKPAAATEQAAQPAPSATPVKSAAAADQAAQPKTTSLGQVASTTPIIPQSQTKAENAITSAASTSIIGRGAAPNAPADEVSPLQIHIGTATITPVAFMDFTSVFRNKNTNGSIATNFGSVPYTTTLASTLPYAANLSEFRLSTENSRIGLRVDADVKGAHVMGYLEADFHGNNAASVGISTNSNTLRERVYFVDLKTEHFEILGGQPWTLLTPGRTGISPLPADIFYSQDVDVNYQLGLVFGRIPELRFVYHPNKQWAWAFALDSPDQYLGGNGGISATAVTLPTEGAFSTYTTQLDNAGNTLSPPNLAPDLITKLAFDPNKHAHFEIGGVERTFKVYYPGSAANGSFAAVPAQTYTTEGSGGFVNLSFEVVKGFRLLTNNFYSDGGGRYIYGLAPDLVVRSNGSISSLHSASTVTGFEANMKNTMIYAYYGGIWIGRDIGLDQNGTTPIGYGYSLPGQLTSAQIATMQSQNRDFQELTFGFNQTFWKNPKYGALNFMGQYSYLLRSPFEVGIGNSSTASPGTVSPTTANVNMLFFNLRYTLPGSAPTMGKVY
jgi:hypothetical protein